MAIPIRLRGLCFATMLACVCASALLIFPRSAGGGEDVQIPDFVQNKKYAAAYAKAMEYVHANLSSKTAPRPIGSMLGGHVFSGFAMMMTEETPSADLKKCVKYCCHAVKDSGFNRNWYLSMCMYFLAEYSLKYGPTDEIRTALKDALEMAAEQQEETGGWCHHLKMWSEDDYNKKGGGQDITIITTLIYAALLEMKTFGMDAGTMTDKVRKNLDSLSDGYGFNYGTDNKVHDSCMGRGAYVLLGAYATGQRDNPFVPKIIKGLEKRYKAADEGHAYPPLHYFGIAASMHRVGPEMYKKFTDEYLDRLIAKQEADGSVVLSGKQTKTDGLYDAPADTAVLACIILMTKPGIFSPYDRIAGAMAKAAAAKADEARRAEAAASAARIAAAARKEPEAPAIAEELLSPWIEKLHAVVVSGSKAGARPAVEIAISKNATQKGKVLACSDRELLVEFDNGGKLTFEWQRLNRRKNMLSLARGFAKKDSVSDQLILGVFLLANGETKGAESTFDHVLEIDSAAGKKLVEETKKLLKL